MGCRLAAKRLVVSLQKLDVSMVGQGGHCDNKVVHIGEDHTFFYYRVERGDVDNEEQQRDGGALGGAYIVWKTSSIYTHFQSCVQLIPRKYLMSHTWLHGCVAPTYTDMRPYRIRKSYISTKSDCTKSLAELLYNFYDMAGSLIILPDAKND